MKKITNLLACGCLALFLVGCGGSGGSASNGGSSIINPPPVQASGFSNASLSGTYALSFVGAGVANTQIYEIDNGVGTIQLDGNGGVSDGSVTSYGSGGTCAYSLSGSYSVQPTGAATFALTLAAAQANAGTCGIGGTGALAAELGQSGTSFAFAETDYTATGGIEQGTAVKQQ